MKTLIKIFIFNLVVSVAGFFPIMFTAAITEQFLADNKIYPLGTGWKAAFGVLGLIWIILMASYIVIANMIFFRVTKTTLGISLLGYVGRVILLYITAVICLLFLALLFGW